jgi:hypothetical protein
MAVLDLDAKRAARSEVENKPHEVVFGGETFLFPVRMPLEFMDLLDVTPRQAFALLFDEDVDATPAGGEITARFFKHRPDDGDLREISRALYSTDLGESKASPDTSANGGRPSKRTGKRTISGTSRPTATAPTTSASESS